MKASLALLCAAALLATLPTAAQSQHRTRRYAPPAEEGRSVAPPPSACVPLCSLDTTPCDPPNFKAADGRCAYPMIGR